MAFLEQRLNLKLTQKQVLTPSLVQMVSILALNKLELSEMISQELMENPVLEEGPPRSTSRPRTVPLRKSDPLTPRTRRLSRSRSLRTGSPRIPSNRSTTEVSSMTIWTRAIAPRRRVR